MTAVPTLSLTTPAGTIEIPQLGFGVFQVPDEQAADVVRQALEAGYRSIDTAKAYGNEGGVGEGLRASGLSGHDVFVTTKLWNDDHDNVPAALRASLDRLQLEAVDLYLMHWPVPSQDRYVQAWSGLLQVRDEGLTRAVGVCNFTTSHLQRVADETGELPPINQIELHPYFQQREMREFHSARGVLTEAWSPLGQGGELLEDAVITEIAKAHRVTPAQVVLRWHVQLGNVVIPKSATPERIRANLDVLGFELSGQEMARIEALDRGADGRIGPDPDTFDRT